MKELLIPEKEFFSIGEVSRIAELEPYVLRYWESEFKLLRPARRTSGHRKYTKKEIDVVFKIKDLLYDKHFTIAGAKKSLLAERHKKPEQLRFDLQESSMAVELLKSIKKDLEELYKIVKE